ncbi:unnamed protein product, partial [marine sediment metagenome]
MDALGETIETSYTDFTGYFGYSVDGTPDSRDAWYTSKPDFNHLTHFDRPIAIRS